MSRCAAAPPAGDGHRYLPRARYARFMPEPTLQDLEAQLVAARASIAELSKANAELTAALADSGAALKRARRNARQDGNTLRDEISSLQQRRG